MSKVGGAGGLPRRLPGRHVPLLVLLPLALHVQGRHQLPALRLEALWRRKGAVALPAKHFHAQRAGAELVGRELQRLLAAAAARRCERLEAQRDLSCAALAVDRHRGSSEAPSRTAVDVQQGLRQAAAGVSVGAARCLEAAGRGGLRGTRQLDGRLECQGAAQGAP